MRSNQDLGEQSEYDEEWVFGWDSGYAEKLEQPRLHALMAVEPVSTHVAFVGTDPDLGFVVGASASPVLISGAP